MYSRKAAIGAVAVALFLVAAPLVGHAQDPPMPTTTDTIAPVTTPPGEPTPVYTPEPTPEPAEPTPEPAPVVTPTPPAAFPPPPAAVEAPARATVITSAGAIGPVTLPPQELGPMTIGNFSAAVRSQADHLARLRRLTNLSADHVTIINTGSLSPSPETAGIEASLSRAEARAESVRSAITGNAVVSSALASAGISAESVVAVSVRGHELNDVTIYHR